ncbi:JNK1/MAPK8-associated membrane protein-like isoform X3 [Clavelina lepadiformis]|uniref:JNK1/MAPK8-associated membrane protein n=1 Tax=Clavelina lepadiformis TaxID=159417 RepID=A0ABP0FLJ5_CLALP
MPCNESLQLYDWLYLGFMAILPLALHWLYIFSVCQHKSKLAVMHILSAPCELCFAGIVSLLLFSPAGTLDLDSCTVRQLSDWYTIFFNPKIKYTTTLHCAQEAVYPLYSIVFVCYLFSLSLSIILRPIWTYKCVGKGAERKLSTKVTYAALYFYPTLMLIHAIAAGLLYYSFEYLLILASMIAMVIYCIKRDLLNVRDIFNERKILQHTFIFFCHLLLLSYAIIATGTFFAMNISQILPYLSATPIPLAFFFLTVQFTDPNTVALETTNREL